MKPFIKWAGGKFRLLKEIEQRLPADFDTWEDVTYIEPFVGGGSVLFHMLSKHKNITKAIINDINPILMQSYQRIKENPNNIIEKLCSLQEDYCSIEDAVAREYFYYRVREHFNSMRILDDQKVAFFIFLNHTCYNGLYRENRSGKFNVPHGKYKNPLIFDKENLVALHKMLQKVEINNGDFSKIFKQTWHPSTFVYMDPPYRQVNKETKMFTSYEGRGFTDEDQIRVKDICDILSNKGCKVMISNSDSYNDDGTSYFEKHFNKGYFINRIQVTRMINPYNSKNRKPKEVIITNYAIPNQNIDINFN